MAPTPKKKHSHSRTRQRRGKREIVMPQLSVCKSCGKKKYPHKACPHCGSKE